MRVNRQGADHESTKLDKVWKGLHEVQQRVRSGRYRVITEKGVEKMFHTVDMKPYIGPSERNEPPLQHYTDVEYGVDSPDWVLEDVLRHAPRERKKEMHWRVKYQGYDKPEWQPASAFMHKITDAWVEYNHKHDLDIALSDVRSDIWSVQTISSHPIHRNIKTIVDYIKG